MGLLRAHSLRNQTRAGRCRTAFQLEEEEASVLTSSCHFSLESELIQQGSTSLNAAAAAEAQKEAVAAQRLDGLDESWEAMNAMDDDQTVCWLEQKLDEVESYLMPAASAELEPLLLLEGVTSSPPVRPVEGSPSVEETKEVTRGSAEEEAFLESALIDAEADSNEEEVIIMDEEEEEALILDEEEEGESKEEISLEAIVLHELESVVSKLDTGMRLCVQNALYRLAESAAMRQGLHGNSTPSRLGGTESIEACTNFFDRTIANLLFHRHTPSTQALQTEQSASSTSSTVSNPTMFSPVMVHGPVKMPFPPIHKHRCAATREAKKPATMVMNSQSSQAVVKLPAVMTNKQLDFPSVPMPSYTKQPMMTTKASGVQSHASVARKLPEYTVQAMVGKKVPSFAEKRRRPMSTTTSRKRVKLL